MNREKSILKEWVTLITSFVVGFAAIYLGFLAFGWDLLGLGLLIQNAPAFARPLLYVVGMFGIISFLLLVISLLEQKKS